MSSGTAPPASPHPPGQPAGAVFLKTSTATLIPITGLLPAAAKSSNESHMDVGLSGK
jgi:hypothetical protein